MMFINCGKCLSEPRQLLRAIAVILCGCLASYQLSECFRKILHPPISTHYTFQLNRSMHYPSITVCKNPAYKTEILQKYGMDGCSPHYSGSWKNFNFGNNNLDSFFDEATYNKREILPLVAFDGYQKNVTVKSFLRLKHGRCFTFTPKNDSNRWDSSGAGYRFYMRHVEKNLSSSRVNLTGYNIYLHEPEDVITETLNQIDSYVEHLFVEPGEDLHYTLRTNEYNSLPGRDNNCVQTLGYSKSKCTEDCLRLKITEEVGCSTPWMQNEKLHSCNDYESVRSILVLYSAYTTKGIAANCNCPPRCNISIYLPYAKKRKEVDTRQTIFTIYYASNLVQVMEEVTGYDWNIFLADLGGSLGFLLGISVLGIVGLMETIVRSFRKATPASKPEDDSRKKGIQIFLNGEKIDEQELYQHFSADYHVEKYFNEKNNIKY